MKKIVFTITLLSSLTLHAEESYGLMQGVADYFFADDKKEVQAKEKTQNNSATVSTNKSMSMEKTDTKKDEESYGLMQGMADSLFGSSEEKESISEDGTVKKKRTSLKNEIDDNEPATLQNWIDKRLNQGKYNPDEMAGEKRERFIAEENHINEQRKIDHEKGLSMQSLVDMFAGQGSYSVENMKTETSEK